ncbi:MAG: glycerophosphoryl diester phosphodiesterase membrane domain-containing protein [Bacillota bacterium]
MENHILLSFEDFKRNWEKYLGFSLIYLLLSSYILIPLLSYIFNRLLLAVSSGVLLNNNAFSILLDPVGVIGLIILVTLAVIFIFIEIGTLIIITHKNNQGKDILISEGIITAVRSIKSIIGFGIIHLALLLLIIMPAINIPVIPEISELINLPSFLIDNILGNFTLKTIYYTIILTFAYFLIRLIFTMHEVIIAKEKVWQAMKNSFNLTKKVSFKILFKLIALNMVIFLTGFLIFTGISYLPGLISGELNYILNNYFITISSFVTLVYSLALMPLNIIFITKLYYQVKNIPFTESKIRTYNLRLFEKAEKFFYNLFNNRKTAVILILIINLIASFFIGYFTTQSTIYAGRDVKIISHRGIVDGEFENSLSAIRASLEADIDAVGMDVQLTKDNQIVLNHDLTLTRTFALPYRIGDLTYEEISNLNVETPEGFLPTDNILPTLNEALSLIDGQMDIHIDVKTNNNADIFAEKIAETVEKNDMIENTYIQSFDSEFLAKLENLNSDIITNQIIYYALGDLSRVKADYLTIYHGMLSTNLVRNARQKDKGIWVWTANSEEDIHNALQYDIDGIITDYPLRVKEIMGRQTN